MQLSDAEWRVMNVLWERHPATVREVLEVLERETGWTVSTVRGVLARLVDRRAVRVRRRARANVYEPRLSRDEAQRSAVRTLLDRAFDGRSGSLADHLIEHHRLSRKNRARVQRLIAGTNGRGRKKAR